MSIRAVTIAVGPHYREAGQKAAESCRRYLGLDPAVITDTGDARPAVFKLRLLDLFPSETVLYFDADARFLRPWDVSGFADQPWPVAVLDWPSSARDADCGRYNIDPARYVASGFWIANRRHIGIWRKAFELATSPDYVTAFKYEQTALNVSLARSQTPITVLSRRYFWVPTRDRPAPASAVAVAMGGDAPEDRAAYDEAVSRKQEA